MKKCINCGKMNLDSAATCKDCQCEMFTEFEIKKPIDNADKDKAEFHDALKASKLNHIGASIVGFLAMYFPIYIVIVIADWFLNYEFIAALIIDLVLTAIAFSIWYLKSDKEKLIELEFQKDQTSVCPHCGSHNISLGRKGYDWKRGFWYRMFNIKGGHYLAGMDSRQIIGYCNDCKHKWETNKQWIR